jgi:hypothetical protein
MVQETERLEEMTKSIMLSQALFTTSGASAQKEDDDRKRRMKIQHKKTIYGIACN